MTSRGPSKRVRKAPAERRSEIVTAAARVGLTEGLECITLRRVADELGVQSGLVGHYFPAADNLVAEAFTSATMADLDSLLPEEPADPGHSTPLHTLKRFFTLISSTDFDNISKLWLNARHLSRYRPVLRDHVVDQELLWCRRIEGSSPPARRHRRSAVTTPGRPPCASSSRSTEPAPTSTRAPPTARPRSPT
ncbi:TetR family transcriptional regulator [Streptomyces sp. M10(2022)]